MYSEIKHLIQFKNNIGFVNSSGSGVKLWQSVKTLAEWLSRRLWHSRKQWQPLYGSGNEGEERTEEKPDDDEETPEPLSTGAAPESPEPRRSARDLKPQGCFCE